MKPTNSFLANSFFLLWVIVCISLFLGTAGTISHIHQFHFEGVDQFLKGLFRINFYNYLHSLEFLQKVVYFFVSYEKYFSLGY